MLNVCKYVVHIYAYDVCTWTSVAYSLLFLYRGHRDSRSSVDTPKSFNVCENDFPSKLFFGKHYQQMSSFAGVNEIIFFV